MLPFYEDLVFLGGVAKNGQCHQSVWLMESKTRVWRGLTAEHAVERVGLSRPGARCFASRRSACGRRFLNLNLAVPLKVLFCLSYLCAR